MTDEQPHTSPGSESGSLDLRRVLTGWPHDPNQNLRIVRGEDGREILQVRLPLGLEQYELEGRPDGQRPLGKESMLDYHLEKLAQFEADDGDVFFDLDPAACEELFEEGTLYYYRYLHCFQLCDWKRTVRDTARNLKLFDLVKKYAVREDHRSHLEKWRPYLIRMNVAASALLEVDSRNFAKAVKLVREGLADIEMLEEMNDETFQFERQRAQSALRELLAQIEKSRPVSKLERLEKALKKAIAIQEFERAAVLRDEIRELRKQGENP